TIFRYIIFVSFFFTAPTPSMIYTLSLHDALPIFILGIITVPRLWWLEVLMIVLIMGITVIIFKKMGSLFDRVQDLMDKINTQAKENLQGVRVVKSFNQEGQEIDKFNQTSDNLNNVNLKIG